MFGELRAVEAMIRADDKAEGDCLDHSQLVLDLAAAAAASASAGTCFGTT